MKKHHPKSGGFSLVEMLVVIAVIGILAAITIPQIGKKNDSQNSPGSTPTSSVEPSQQEVGVSTERAHQVAKMIAETYNHLLDSGNIEPGRADATIVASVIDQSDGLSGGHDLTDLFTETEIAAAIPRIWNNESGTWRAGRDKNVPPPKRS